MEVWFQDEARVGQKGSIEYVWAMIGSRPPMVRDTRHDSVHIFGAICPARGTGAAIIMPAVNTEAMNEHLAEISLQVAPRNVSTTLRQVFVQFRLVCLALLGGGLIQAAVGLFGGVRWWRDDTFLGRGFP